MKTKKDTLYYDSDCPICSAEMAKLERLKTDNLTLQPIKHADVSEIKRADLYRELHVETADGQNLRGYDANIYAWQQTRYRRIATWFRYPPLSWLGKLGYTIWLRYYQRRRKQRIG